MTQNAGTGNVTGLKITGLVFARIIKYTLVSFDIFAIGVLKVIISHI